MVIPLPPLFVLRNLCMFPKSARIRRMLWSLTKYILKTISIKYDKIITFFPLIVNKAVLSFAKLHKSCFHFSQTKSSDFIFNQSKSSDFISANQNPAILFQPIKIIKSLFVSPIKKFFEFFFIRIFSWFIFWTVLSLFVFMLCCFFLFLLHLCHPVRQTRQMLYVAGKLNKTWDCDEHFFGQVNTRTGCYQLPLFRCTILHR